ncbi:MAG: hypothetical protein J7M39_01820 [Anaerolineae bacterium]|nr:hypothetical protein [Anaerolineae bacterium]
MSQIKDQEPLRFWRLVGLVLAGAVMRVLLGVLIDPGYSQARWSDALCTSAAVLGVGSSISFLFDAGRGLTLPGTKHGDTDDRRVTWDTERSKREKGLTVTFALALAATGMSLLILQTSLWSETSP